jgi:lipid A 3-O-deacylase
MAIRSQTVVSVGLLFLLQVVPYAGAQDLKTESFSAGPSTLYVKNRLSAQFAAGALFGPVSWVHEHATFNYAQTNLRFGWMATDPAKTKYFGTGNFELLFELTNSLILEGSGNYLRGFTLLGRYNLLLADPGWALYFQIGAGVITNDAYKDMAQTEIGQAIEFTPQGSIGLRYFIAPKWTVDVEAMYHHISNAGLSERNGGINAVGGFLGVTYFLDKLWR